MNDIRISSFSDLTKIMFNDLIKLSKEINCKNKSTIEQIIERYNDVQYEVPLEITEEEIKQRLLSRKIIHDLKNATFTPILGYISINKWDKISSKCINYGKDILNIFNRYCERDKPKIQFNINQYLEKYNLKLKENFNIQAYPEIKLLFQNIIINSLHVSKKIDVEGFKLEDVLKISIRDYGPGFPKTLLSDLFDPFVTTKKEKGHGIGLSIVYDVIKLHDGLIKLRTNKRGSRFDIILPINDLERLKRYSIDENGNLYSENIIINGDLKWIENVGKNQKHKDLSIKRVSLDKLTDNVNKINQLITIVKELEALGSDKKDIVKKILNSDITLEEALKMQNNLTKRVGIYSKIPEIPKFVENYGLDVMRKLYNIIQEDEDKKESLIKRANSIKQKYDPKNEYFLDDFSIIVNNYNNKSGQVLNVAESYGKIHKKFVKKVTDSMKTVSEYFKDKNMDEKEFEKFLNNLSDETLKKILNKNKDQVFKTNLEKYISKYHKSINFLTKISKKKFYNSISYLTKVFEDKKKYDLVSL